MKTAVEGWENMTHAGSLQSPTQFLSSLYPGIMELLRSKHQALGRKPSLWRSKALENADPVEDDEDGAHPPHMAASSREVALVHDTIKAAATEIAPKQKKKKKTRDTAGTTEGPAAGPVLPDDGQAPVRKKKKKHVSTNTIAPPATAIEAPRQPKTKEKAPRFGG